MKYQKHNVFAALSLLSVSVVALALSSGCGKNTQISKGETLEVSNTSTTAGNEENGAYIVLPDEDVPVEQPVPGLYPEEKLEPLESPEKQNPVSALFGHCKRNLEPTESGHQRRCCSAITGPSYFLNSSGNSRNCDGRWEKLDSDCPLGDRGKNQGMVWQCNTPSSQDSEASDGDDENLDENISKKIRSADPLIENRVSETALRLAKLDTSDYRQIQRKYLGTGYPACNYFVITSLCQSGLCTRTKPLYTASAFDRYFTKTGWKIVTLRELKEMFRDRDDFDAVLQRKKIPPAKHGHIALAVGLHSSGNLILAEGALGVASNRLRVVSNNYVEKYKGGFTIFVKE